MSVLKFPRQLNLSKLVARFC